MNFDTKLLEGKVKEDPDQGESIKPVSSMHPCLYLVVLGNGWNTCITGYSAKIILPWGPSLEVLRPLDFFSCLDAENILGISSKQKHSHLKSCFNTFFFQLTFARFYLPILVPRAKKAIYMDDDVIVQGTEECHIIAALCPLWAVLFVLLMVTL